MSPFDVNEYFHRAIEQENRVRVKRLAAFNPESWEQNEFQKDKAEVLSDDHLQRTLAAYFLFSYRQTKENCDNDVTGPPNQEGGKDENLID